VDTQTTIQKYDIRILKNKKDTFMNTYGIDKTWN